MKRNYMGRLLGAAILVTMLLITPTRAARAETDSILNTNAGNNDAAAEATSILKTDARNYDELAESDSILKTNAEGYDATAETEEESAPDLPEDKVSTIIADYSATELAGQEFPFPSITAFSDASCENELDLEFAFSGVDKVVYQFHRDVAPETIYLIPPVVPVLRRVEKTELIATDETVEPANGCSIKDVFVRKERGFLEKEPTWYEVYVIIDSKTGEYPDNLIMKSDGKIYSGAQSVRFSSPDPATQTLVELSYHFKVSDEADEALDALDHASFTYTKLVHYEAANDWNFSCEDAKLEIIEASVDT